MACFVDDLFPTQSRIGWRYQDACHLVCDTHEELVAFGEKIKLKPSWIQKPETPQEHFDLTKERRYWAVAFGAQEVPARRIAEIMRDKTRKLAEVGNG